LLVTKPLASAATIFHKGKPVTTLKGAELDVTGKDISLAINPGTATEASCTLQLLYGDTPIGDVQTFHWQAQFKPDPATEALFAAAEQGNIAAIEQAIEQGADINTPNWSGRTPLHMAIILGQGNQAVIELLISKGANIHATNVLGNTPLDDAISWQNEAVVLTLLAHGASINTRDKDGDTPLHEAGSNKHLTPENAGFKKRVIELLVSKGADVNTTNKYGSTPYTRLLS